MEQVNQSGFSELDMEILVDGNNRPDNADIFKDSKEG